MLRAVIERVRGTGRCVLLTGKDTFGGDLNWSTGIARCNGTTAVVSVCRLDPAFWGDAQNRDLHYKRARKIMLHELGHTFGRLDHCDDWNCAVHGSNSIGEIDRTGENYCARCDAIARTAIAAIRGKP
jgi:archaemetzincin